MELTTLCEKLFKFDDDTWAQLVNNYVTKLGVKDVLQKIEKGAERNWKVCRYADYG